MKQYLPTFCCLPSPLVIALPSPPLTGLSHCDWCGFQEWGRSGDKRWDDQIGDYGNSDEV